MLIWPLLAGAAGAQDGNACIDRCFSTYTPSENSPFNDLRDLCLAQCRAPATLYGAIAYGARSTANGYAYGKASRGDAQRTAMVNCRAHGDDCKIVADYANSCAAVAAVEAKSRFATGGGRSRAEAEANALGACRKQVGGQCEIEVWSCAK